MSFSSKCCEQAQERNIFFGRCGRKSKRKQIKKVNATSSAQTNEKKHGLGMTRKQITQVPIPSVWRPMKRSVFLECRALKSNNFLLLFFMPVGTAPEHRPIQRSIVLEWHGSISDTFFVYLVGIGHEAMAWKEIEADQTSSCTQTNEKKHCFDLT